MKIRTSVTMPTEGSAASMASKLYLDASMPKVSTLVDALDY